VSRRCGLIAIVGRPNVGKSTLLNQILRQKISITSRKPQTTRYQILGLHTVADTQLVFVDTPGWQRQPQNHLNRLMNRRVHQAIADVDCALMLSDARGWHTDDALVASILIEAGVPGLLALNKRDMLKSKTALLPQITELTAKFPLFEEFFPICARTGAGVDVLIEDLLRRMPEREHLFPPDQVTDRSERFLCGEIIREKTMRYLGDELPYRTSVIVDEVKEEATITRIFATVWVDRDSQKAIVIGKGGALMKKISTDARLEIERMLQTKVFLKVWVKTKRGWADSPEALQTIGLTD
jgi:GTP-binding protein Era